MPRGPNDTILMRARTGRTQELHLRERSVPDLPTVLDLAGYATEEGRYHQVVVFPDDPEVIRQLITALQERLEHHDAG